MPGKILTGLTFMKNIEVDYEYPSMTMMVGGGWNSAMSNIMVNAAMQSNGKFREAYVMLNLNRKQYESTALKSENVHVMT